jgi:hypothetical protein
MNWQRARERRSMPRPTLAAMMGWEIDDVVALEEGRRQLNMFERERLLRLLEPESSQLLFDYLRRLTHQLLAPFRR